MNDAIDLMEERLAMAAKRLEKYSDENIENNEDIDAFEHMASDFERSYGTADNVARDAIRMLKELLNAAK